MESEATIPFGVNSRGEEHSIEVASPRDIYFCLECGKRLRQGRGRVYRHYFAHRSDARDCPLINRDAIIKFINDVREDAIQYNFSRIRIFVECSPYSSELTLFGSIPTLTIEDIAKVKQAVNPIDSKGTSRQVSVNNILPSTKLQWIELDPSAQSYEINISPSTVSIAGAWKARELRPNDFFIGDRDSGEFVENPRYLARGNFIYIISPTFIDALPKEADKFRLGTKEVVRLEATQEIVRTLSKLSGRELFFDNNPMRVDIILPFMTNPRAQSYGYIQGPRGSEALVALIPPLTSDPDFELLPIPFFKGDRVCLPRTGTGKPRFIRISLDKMCFKRLLIHWPGNKYRDILLDFSIHSAGQEYETPSAIEFGIEVQAETSSQRLIAIHSPRLEIHGPVLPLFKPLFPKGFKIKLSAEYPDPNGLPIWKDEDIEYENFSERIRTIIETGARTLKVEFGGFGSIEIVCNFFYNKIKSEYKESILVKHLRGLELLPKSVSKQFVEECLHLIGGVDSSEYYRWRRKIKRKIKSIRKQRKKLRMKARNSYITDFGSSQEVV